MKRAEEIRYRESILSPIFNFSLSEDGMSPVTDLAMNLSGTSLNSGLRPRRLSLSSCENTPTTGIRKMILSDDGDTPVAVENKLLKNAIRIPCNRSRSIPARRLLHPAGGKSPDKENRDEPHSSPSKISFLRQQSSSPLRPRVPLEDHDTNSQDSGYGVFCPDKDEGKTGFRFMEPSGIPPRRYHIEQSPLKENHGSSGNDIGPSPRSDKVNQSPRICYSRSLFHSISSSSGCESIDEEFLDLLDGDKVEEDSKFPAHFTSLLSGPILEPVKQNSTSANNDLKSRRSLVRSFSCTDAVTPPSSKVRENLFDKMCGLKAASKPTELASALLEPSRPFKRPEPPCDNISPTFVKRRKSNSLQCIFEDQTVACSVNEKTVYRVEKPTVTLQRSFSETEATIKRALQRSTQDPDLIGDFSKPFILPLKPGRHQDLKAISSETLAELICGKYSTVVDSYTIIDCRYPYEYEGGHIKGAVNLYTREQIIKKYFEVENVNLPVDPSKRNILIFHCEFSSERGPTLSRFLRNSDRDQNKEAYPNLNYPELYLLDGGYKNFYERHKELCEPQSYLPMLDPRHEVDLRYFRSKSKSWNGDGRNRMAARSSLKRLGL